MKYFFPLLIMSSWVHAGEIDFKFNSVYAKIQNLIGTFSKQAAELQLKEASPTIIEIEKMRIELQDIAQSSKYPPEKQRLFTSIETLGRQIESNVYSKLVSQPCAAYGKTQSEIFSTIARAYIPHLIGA